MKPYLHAKASARLHGGKPEDYMPIHNFIDSSKSNVPDVRHRALLHNSFGCFMVEEKFGAVAVNSDGKEYSPRDIAEEHIIQDLGFIPTVEMYLKNMQIVGWMSGTKRGLVTKSKKSASAKTESNIVD